MSARSRYVPMMLVVDDSAFTAQGSLSDTTYALITRPGMINRRLRAFTVASTSALAVLVLFAVVSWTIHGEQRNALQTATASNAIGEAAILEGHHIRSMHVHLCLDWSSILIHSKPCDPYSRKQKWTITQGVVRRVKSMGSRCLDYGGKHVHIWSCTDNRHQLWTFNKTQGTISAFYHCLRASRTHGIVEVVKCDPTDKYQQWKFKLPEQLTTTTTKEPVTTIKKTAKANEAESKEEGDDRGDMKEVKDNDAYCWLVAQSSGEEAGLVRAHYVKGCNIFSCRGWSVFTDKDDLTPVSAVTNIGPVKSKKGPWGSWYNTEVFLRAWDAVVAGGKYRAHPWTLKVDVDTVFFPGRLSAHVGSLNPNDPWFLKNDGMLYAPVEVFSRAAVGLYAAKGRQKCRNAGARAGEEDSFFDYCMHTLGVASRADEHLLKSCGEPDGCRDRPFLAFHPFKTPALYDNCVSAASGGEEQDKDKALTGFCCLWGTDCYSCTGGNRVNRSTWCGSNPQNCGSCGQHSTWCQPPREPVKCGDRRVITLYHQTSPHICDLIMQSNFRMGKVGWCGGGIYFATEAQATNQKCIGPQSNKGCILQVQVDVGRTALKGRLCNRSLLGEDLLAAGYDSVSFDPGDGQEYAVYRSSQILSIRRYGWWLPDAQTHAGYWAVPGR